MKIAFVDTYYPRALESMYTSDAALGTKSYPDQLSAVLSRGFGTADFYSRNFATLGWDCRDVIGNSPDIQGRWLVEHGINPCGFSFPSVALRQIAEFAPDVVFVQDVSFFSQDELQRLKASGIFLAAQHSCPWAGDLRVGEFDVVFTSFPHYDHCIRSLGVECHLVPLAFEHTLRDRAKSPTGQRDIDIAFVGGVGRGSHWERGMDVLEAVADAFPDQFRWWGYGADSLGMDSMLRRAWEGEAWGIKQYEVYARSKIVINRHGEVAQGALNNMRCFEATGMGAALVTDNSADAVERGLFTADEINGYTLPVNAVQACRWLLDSGLWATTGNLGRDRTLREHTYERRMVEVSEHLLAAMAKGRAVVPASGAYMPLTNDRQIAILGDRFADSWKDSATTDGQAVLGYGEVERWKRGESVAPFDALRKLMASPALAGISTIHETGCGAGYNLAVLRHCGFTGEYTGTDYSQNMVAEAFARTEYCDRARFLLWDCRKPDAPFNVDLSADLMIEGCAILHIADWRTAISNVAACARRFLILHRLPLVRPGEPPFSRKEAYGVPCIERRFDRLGIVDAVATLGFVEHGTVSVSDSCESILFQRIMGIVK